MATPAAQARPPQTARPAPAIEILEVAPDTNFIASLTRGEVLSQVEVARRWPRVISTFIAQTRTMALLDEETSASCFYALPRRQGDEDRTIEGPSIRFAEIVCSAWGHMRVEGRTVEELERFVVSRGTAWDVQQNNIFAYEVRRRIINKHNRRYNDDMIAVTANAAASIAMRDAILRCIPQPLWRSIWQEAKRVAVGDGTTLSKKRKEMLDYFQKLGVRPERALAVVGAQTEADVTLERLTVLRGLATAIKDGQTSVDDAFPDLRPGQGPVQMPQRQEPAVPPSSPGAPASTSPGTATTQATEVAAPPASAPDSDPPPPSITITALEPIERPGKSKYWRVAFSNGERAVTFSTTMGAALEAGRDKGTVYDDVVFRKEGNFIYVIELLPRQEEGPHA